MSKIWIKPLRNLWVNNGETVLHDGKVVELEEDAAQELLKNGWAEFAEKPTKPKSSKNDKTPPENPSATPPENPDGEQTGEQTPTQPSLTDQTETPAQTPAENA